MILPLEQLARQLGHEFENTVLLGLALTHRSAGGEHNERLEFLGDAILGFIVADLLYHRFPKADEGQLSRLRASLVRRETLAEIAKELDLSSYLQMGAGELASGGQSRTSTLADALEAVLGAVYLDGGEESVRKLIERLFGPRIAVLNLNQVIKDAKTRLQEFRQALARSLPVYEVLTVSGHQHDQRFRVICRLEDDDSRSEGEGTSRRRAEQAAAAAMLELLNA